jgi:hypothetical protein
MPAGGNTDELLRAAIEQKRLIELIYKEKPRIVEPHDYGVHNGSVKLLGYQVGGFSSGPLPNWRWMKVNSISDVRLLNRTFPGGRPGPAGKHHYWDQLFLRVKPPEDEEQ